ncbi:MAG: NUDIX hydrolase [Anaerolineales bacterium]|jgi:8-oxo-dGTP pyrophosphatase MutT (NUDIX family)
MSLKPWKILNSKYLYKTKNVALRIDQCKVPNGSIFEPYVLECGTWVNVIALTKAREVVLVTQYRHGVGQVMLEIPAGLMDEEDENPVQTAQRELLEETGYTGERFIEVGKAYPNPATHNNLTYSFLALDVEKAGGQHLDETEEIEVSLMSFDELISVAKEGGLPQALHISALFFAMAYLERNL